jgi:hypothetical protein
MKKLILIPTIAITAALAFSFALPGVASNAIRTIAPIAAVHSATAATVGGNAQAAARSLGSGNVARPVSTDVGSTAAGSSSTTPLTTSGQFAHSPSTPPQENCGRYGGGYHGGKHLFVCPNRPFPAPVVTHFP